MHVISVLVVDYKLLVIVCKACLFTAISSEVFDHCKLKTLMHMTINSVLYAEAELFQYTLYCFLGLETGVPFLGLAKSIYYI